MKKWTVLFSAVIMLFMAGSTNAEEDYIVGEVREFVRDEKIIQIRERNYIVELILVDSGAAGGPVMGSMFDIETGSLVKIYPTEKKEGFWYAEKAIVYKGLKKEEILKELND